MKLDVIIYSTMVIEYVFPLKHRGISNGPALTTGACQVRVPRVAATAAQCDLLRRRKTIHNGKTLTWTCLFRDYLIPTNPSPILP